MGSPEGAPSEEGSSEEAPSEETRPGEESLEEAHEPAALARLVDPEALDASIGTRARLAVGIDANVRASGGAVRFRVPARLVCARCDGGGCESCSRSGAFRAPEGRTSIDVVLPPGEGPVRLRLEQPFGSESPIEQLLIDIAPVAPSPHVSLALRPSERVLAVPAVRSRIDVKSTIGFVGLAFAFALLVIVALAERCASGG